jgi:hypothetical protein
MNVLIVCVAVAITIPAAFRVVIEIRHKFFQDSKSEEIT